MQSALVVGADPLLVVVVCRFHRSSRPHCSLIQSMERQIVPSFSAYSPVPKSTILRPPTNVDSTLTRPLLAEPTLQCLHRCTKTPTLETGFATIKPISYRTMTPMCLVMHMRALTVAAVIMEFVFPVILCMLGCRSTQIAPQLTPHRAWQNIRCELSPFQQCSDRRNQTRESNEDHCESTMIGLEIRLRYHERKQV
jgi:hypothetical protein